MCRYLVGLLLILGLSSCKKLTEVDATGTVRDATDLAPVEGVKVSLYEDNDGAFMGNHLLQETTTDASGAFRFNFKYKEGPYKIYVSREGYVYSRKVTDKILGATAYFDYQEIEPHKHEQHLTFDMDPVSDLTLKIKNVAPVLWSDHLKIELSTAAKEPAYFIREFTGATDQELMVGPVRANKYTYLTYSVTENGIARSVKDSIFVERHKPAVYNLNY